jgi:ATP-binding protein involved in chromosome partitioning
MFLFLEVPIVQSFVKQVIMVVPQHCGSVVANVFEEITRKVVEQTVRRNESLPATEAIKITTMAGCAAVKNNIRFIQ